MCILGAGYQSAFDHYDKIHEIITFQKGERYRAVVAQAVVSRVM